MQNPLEGLGRRHVWREKVKVDGTGRVDVNTEFLQACEEACVSGSVLVEGGCDVFRQGWDLNDAKKRG